MVINHRVVSFIIIMILIIGSILPYMNTLPWIELKTKIELNCKLNAMWAINNTYKSTTTKSKKKIKLEHIIYYIVE